MITGQEGGFIHRSMPPANWDCGPIPQECYNPELTPNEIRKILLSVYLEPDRVKKLANSDDKVEIMRAKLALECLAEIDANTVWISNHKRKS